jgi:sucrose phosphorylase
LARNDAAYLLARAIQFFMPGIPQVYYVGLLAGENDLDLLAKSGVGRDINRHRYSPGEIASALGRPVVAKLLELIRLRNEHPAFGGVFALQDSAPDRLVMCWQAGTQRAELQADLQTGSGRVLLSDGVAPERVIELRAD